MLEAVVWDSGELEEELDLLCPMFFLGLVCEWIDSEEDEEYGMFFYNSSEREVIM